jgi:hypothetical protein
MRQHVHRFRRLAHEIEDAVRLLAEGHRVGLQRMNHVGKLDGVADEEDREIVADEIPVPVLGVELHREATRIAGDLGGIAPTDHSREPDRERRLLAGLLEQLRARVPRGRRVADLARHLEFAIADEAAGVDDALGDALSIEMRDLFEEVIVLQRGGSTAPDGALRLVVHDRMALPVGQLHISASFSCGRVGAIVRRFLRHVRLACVGGIGRRPTPPRQLAFRSWIER